MIELKCNSLWIYINVKKRNTSSRWDWSYQVGEEKIENFTGSAGSRRGAIRAAKKGAKRFVRRHIIVQVTSQEFET